MSFGKFIHLCTALRETVLRTDSLAQLVEHNTFNVGVLGSSPRRITKSKQNRLIFQAVFLWASGLGLRYWGIKAHIPNRNHHEHCIDKLKLLHLRKKDKPICCPETKY